MTSSANVSGPVGLLNPTTRVDRKSADNSNTSGVPFGATTTRT